MIYAQLAERQAVVLLLGGRQFPELGLQLLLRPFERLDDPGVARRTLLLPARTSSRNCSWKDSSGVPRETGSFSNPAETGSKRVTH
jgi:hypothetical protein